MERLGSSPRPVSSAERMRLDVLGLALLCVVAAPVLAVGREPAPGLDPIDARSWRTHPRIVAIRSLVETNEANVKSRAWRQEKRQICASEERPFGMDVAVVRDGRGRVRKYTTVAGTDDSAYTVEHHYDGAGRLRFAFARAGAVNGSDEAYRIYFDERGAEIWRHVTSSGPGYTFMRPPDFPDAVLVRDPVKDLAAPHAWCTRSSGSSLRESSSSCLRAEIRGRNHRVPAGFLSVI